MVAFQINVARSFENDEIFGPFPAIERIFRRPAQMVHFDWVRTARRLEDEFEREAQETKRRRFAYLVANPLPVLSPAYYNPVVKNNLIIDSCNALFPVEVKQLIASYVLPVGEIRLMGIRALGLNAAAHIIQKFFMKYHFGRYSILTDLYVQATDEFSLVTNRAIDETTSPSVRCMLDGIVGFLVPDAVDADEDSDERSTISEIDGVAGDRDIQPDWFHYDQNQRLREEDYLWEKLRIVVSRLPEGPLMNRIRLAFDQDEIVTIVRIISYDGSADRPYELDDGDEIAADGTEAHPYVVSN